MLYRAVLPLEVSKASTPRQETDGQHDDDDLDRKRDVTEITINLRMYTIDQQEGYYKPHAPLLVCMSPATLAVPRH
jgi:hypothetical protein